MTRRLRIGLQVVLATLATAYLLVMFATGALPEARHRIEFQARGVMSQPPETVRGVSLTAEGGTLRFSRRDQEWIREPGGQPLPAQAESALSRAVKFMHTANPVRILDSADLAGTSFAQYGLDTPALRIALSDDQGLVLEADFGGMNTDGFLQYMRVKGREEVFLMSRFVGAEWAAVAASLPGTGSR